MLGLHKINISENQCSYFVKRPFGNYLLFADSLKTLTKSQMELIESYGGISKLTLESSQNINKAHGQIFSRYGASAICDIQIESFHPDIKIERLKDFRDPALTFVYKGQKKLVIFEQKGKKILIAGKEFYLAKDKSVNFQGLDHMTFLMNLKEAHKIDLIYFTHFEDLSVLQFKPNSTLAKIKGLIKSTLGYNLN